MPSNLLILETLIKEQLLKPSKLHVAAPGGGLVALHVIYLALENNALIYSNIPFFNKILLNIISFTVFKCAIKEDNFANIS